MDMVAEARGLVSVPGGGVVMALKMHMAFNGRRHCLRRSWV